MSSNTLPNTALPSTSQDSALPKSRQTERMSPSWGQGAWSSGVQLAQVSERAAAQQVRKSMLAGRRTGQGGDNDPPVEQADALTADRSAQGFDTASDVPAGVQAVGAAAPFVQAATEAPNTMAVSASESQNDRSASLWGQEPASKSSTPSLFGGDHSSLYAVLGGGLVLGAGVSAGGGSGGGGSTTTAGSGGTKPAQPLQVSVQDGYLSHAQVYVDTNANGVADAGELVGTTDAKGQLSFDKSKVAGSILVIGGTNTDTGLPNSLTLKLASGTAFDGAVVISPLTTLVTEVMAQAAQVSGNELTWAQASTLVKHALGISDNVSLHTFDPLSADHLNQTDGLVVHKAAAQLATIASVNELAQTGFSSIAAYINANRSATVNLADSHTLSTVLGESVAATVLADITVANAAIAAAPTSAAVAAAQLSQATPIIVGLTNDTGESGSDRITSDPRVAVQGRNAESVVEYSIDGGRTWASYIDPAQDGTVTVVARLRYDSTTTPVYSGVSDPFTFQLDSRIPKQPVLTLVSDTGVGQDLITNDPRILISGLSDGAVLSVRIDNGEWQTLKVPAEGAPVNLSLGADGTHHVYVKQTYALNGSSAEQQISLTLDTKAQTGSAGLAANDPDAAAENDAGRSKDDDITNNPRPVVEGHAEPGATEVTVGFAGEVFHLTLNHGLQADGSWRITPTHDLSDGSYTPVVTVTDAAGNTSVPTALSPIVIDREAPDASAVTATLAAGSDTGYADDDGVTSINRPLIKGVAEPGATVEVDVDGTVYTTLADGVTGAWSVQVTQALDDGEYTPTITVTDAAGNASEPTEGTPFTVDATAPDVSVPGGLVQGDETFDTGASDSDGITSNNLPLLQGEAEAGVVVVLKIGSQTFSTVVGDDGTWSFQLENELEDGVYTPSLTFIDAAGNILHTKGETLVIDTEAPSEATAELVHDEDNDTGVASDDGITNNNTALIAGTAEAGSHILVDLNGTTFETDADEQGNWSLSLDGLEDGEYTPAITVVDLAGNVSDVIDGTPFVIDTQGPEAAEGGELVHDDVSDTGIDTTDNLTANNQPVLFGTAEPGAVLTIDLNGEIFQTTADDDGNWLLEVDRPLDDGEYTPIITVSDAAGNVTESEGVSFTIDTEAPSADTVTAFVTPDEDNDTGPLNDDGITANNSPVLSGTADPLAMVKVEVDGRTFFTEADEDGAWSVQLDELADGEYTPLITVTDAAGNEGEAIEGTAFTIDTRSPTEGTVELVHDEDNDTGISSDDGITANNSPTFSGTAEAGAHIVLDLNGSTFETDADEDGNWSLTAEGLEDGEYTPLITVTDAAGNTGDPIEGTSFVIDTEGPDAAEGGELTHDDVYDTGLDTTDGITSNAMPMLTGTAAPGVLVKVDLNGEVFETTADDDGNWVLEVDRPLEDGEYTPLITVSDEAGNVTESEGVPFTIDTRPPSSDNVHVAIAADEDNDTGASQSDGITSNNAPVLEGHADAFAQVMVEVDGVTYFTEADEDGAWSVQLDTLSDGEYVPVVTVTDAAGNEGKPVEGTPFTIDTEGPTEVSGGLKVDAVNDTGEANDDGITRNAQPILAGEADPFSIVLVDLGNDRIYSATTDAQGHWSLKLPTALPDGEYLPVLSVTDLAGNTSDGVEIGTIVVDTTLAAFTGGLTADEDNDTGVSSEDGITNNKTPTLSGTAEGGATVVILLAGVRYETQADEDGFWSVEVSGALADGTYTPQITVTDLAGNTATHAGTAFTVDTVANIPGGDIGAHQAVLVGEEVDINVFGANAAYEGNSLEDYGGSLPDGLYIDEATHHIRGKAESAGVTWIAASTSDAAGNIATQYFQLAVSAREKTGVISINNASEESASTYLGSASSEHMNVYSSAKDVLLAGAGDDLFQIYANNDGAAYNFARLDGGAGFDTVKMYGTSLELDLSDFNNPDGSGRVMEHVEAIQFSDRDTSVTLTAADLFHLRSDALDVDGLHSVVRLMAVATNGGTVRMEGLTQVGKDFAYGGNGALTDGKAGNLYSKFTGVYTDSNGDHLVELLLQKGLNAA